ncbi:AMY-1-associating protein expressed in testis 1 [Thecamonas trahens ATCC 50062]|uniref:Cilia- and flagella-associated protein 91 n=1 Tax=Thecamonas trahens ATCC 50062 TaxID=461836 RepID=A0A0L0DR24_THETB|nr:AMY-1-associating protein expressed in testis 1 [Thecamonas trahens ATCC 50062]KNC54466.1 AMY-1-associating protein expressed in testis 1 [Thecamonas trahens ATCC 50062]|eukprot:XP_013753621.1 AMY-1-associating protein expressed in testis 1 [Thecamonas trahens ATCC 50062]
MAIMVEVMDIGMAIMVVVMDMGMAIMVEVMDMGMAIMVVVMDIGMAIMVEVMDMGMAITIMAIMVTGPNRAKYFRKSVVPYMRTVAPSTMLEQVAAADAAASALQTMGGATSGGASRLGVDSRSGRLASAAGATRTSAVDAGLQSAGEGAGSRGTREGARSVGVQTLYRESEAQTDPYTPEYVTRDGEEPELLSLAMFTYGHGLPVTMDEIELIEKAREKRAWEASLPPIDDPDQFELRQRMMEEMEMQEWREREEEIERLQQARLEVLRQMIEQADVENEELNNERVAEVWRLNTLAKEVKVSNVQAARIKTLRKLARRRKKLDPLLSLSALEATKRDIVAEYADFGSHVYAGAKRSGKARDTQDTAQLYDISYAIDLSSRAALDELEAFIPTDAFTPKIDIPIRHTKARTPAERKMRKVTQQLEVVDRAIKKRKDTSQRPRTPLTCAHRIEKPPPRPPTPQLHQPDKAEEEKDVAVILIQSLIRGRAVQNTMFEGKERRLPLIQELRSVHAVSQVERNELAQLRRDALAARAARDKTARSAKAKSAAVESALGSVVGNALEYFSKQLVRLREERRIAAMVKLAERERRRREAAESGRRVAEEARRKVEDEIFAQIMGTHQESVDSYIESVLSSAVAATSRDQALDEARLKAAQLNTLVDELEAQREEPSVVVRDLVTSFLFPEVERRTLQARVAHQQRRFLAGAQAAVRASVANNAASFSDAVAPAPSRARPGSSPLVPRP